jgi:hypothetical protein
MQETFFLMRYLRERRCFLFYFSEESQSAKMAKVTRVSSDSQVMTLFIQKRYLTLS